MLSILKSYHYLKNTLCVLMVLLCINTKGQTELTPASDSLLKANEFYSNKQYDKAIKILDQLITSSETKEDSYTWRLRSISYYFFYKTLNVNYSNLIDTVVKSALTSIRFDSRNEHLSDNKKLIESGAKTYYHVSTKMLNDSLNYTKADLYYNKYKKTIKLVNGSFDEKTKDIEFYNVAGVLFSDLFSDSLINLKEKYKYLDIAKTALLKVLSIDARNISANKTLGILYYNQGCTIINNMDYDIELNEVDVVVENANKLFKQSLPFMNEALNSEPNSEKILLGLEGIYYALNMPDISNEYKLKREALKKQNK